MNGQNYNHFIVIRIPIHLIPFVYLVLKKVLCIESRHNMFLFSLLLINKTVYIKILYRYIDAIERKRGKKKREKKT
ncbi:hypothetical protein EDC94DRAFT_597368 [Helicostylum pulchrum]|nr:hypothetical protein EDC94DRAFT_597368 [Helicostylum pulchrum]